MMGDKLLKDMDKKELIDVIRFFEKEAEYWKKEASRRLELF